MKKYLLIFLALTSVGFFSSCEKLKSLADVEFDADYETELNVDIQPTFKSGVGTFNQTITIDPLTNADFQKYKDKIKNISISSAEITITQLDPSPIVISGTLTASAPNLPSASWSLNNETLTVNKVITLDNNNQQFDKLKDIFNTKNPFDVNVQGQASVPQGTFKCKVKFKTKVKANPLN
ncbi:MAG: hypothetical protein IPM52_09080 [Bacteroidetes bacterium]|nr:hypothetical protein [Bacteroidota bacterium]